MTDVLWTAEAANEGPLVHALIIGISAYDHLGGGTGVPTEEPIFEGLTQLSAAATSATRVALWLRDRFDYPSVTFGSVRLLASPSPDEVPLPGGVSPPPATFDEVRSAIRGWRRDARSGSSNVALLYVAGHGIQMSNEGGIVLLQDAGSPDSLTPLEAAIDVASVRRGMVADPARPDTATPAIQYYFYDACRVLPAASSAYADLPAGVSLDEPRGAAAATSYVIWGSRSRDFALADADTKTTLFSKAFTETLETRAAAGPDGRTVQFAHFTIALEAAVDELAASFGEEQSVVNGGSGQLSTPVYRRPAPSISFDVPGPQPSLIRRPVVVRPDDGLRRALTITDETGSVVEEGLTHQPMDLPLGEYTATVLLPWGGSITAPISVTEAEGELVVPVAVPTQAPGSPQEAPRLDRQLGPSGGAPSGWCLRFLTWTAGDGLLHLETATPPAVEVDDVSEDGVAMILHAQGPALQYAQVRTDDGRSIVVALPILSMAEIESACWLHVRVSDEALGATVRFFDQQKDTIAGYMIGGRPDHAVGLAPSAEQLLFSKMRDPVGAALGAYALLRLNELDRMHDWPANLAEWFDWLPDGAIIAGELAARHGDDGAAADWLARAADRGLPVFSDGLSLLSDRVPHLMADPDLAAATKQDLAARAGLVRALIPTAQFGALTSTLRADPAPAATTAAEGWRRFVRASQPDDPRDFWRDP